MSRSVDVRRAGLARAAGLLVLLGCSLALPAPASAQLGELIVTITSPTAGSTVGGTTPVSATVTIVGSLTVSKVEFRLDGALFAEDTTAPYSVPWNTRTTSNGSHTLVAVGRTPLGV